jgi:hypothetical protein
MNNNVKAGVLVAIAVALLFLVAPKSVVGTRYHKSVTEYDCRIKVVDDPRPLNHQVLATVAIYCDQAPKTTDFVMQLQYRAKSSLQWANIGDAKHLNGQPTPTSVDINITEGCKGGEWRVGYQLSGIGNVTDRPFQELQYWGSGKSISDSQCANS